MNQLYAEIKKDQWLLRHARNINSLSGEDGILEKIFEVLPAGDKWCVEFGAWDGKKYSNTWNLISERGWSAVLIEADSKKFVNLVKNCNKYPKTHCLNRFVTFECETSLDALLRKTAIPKNFDLLSIDIDGNDYHIWDSVKEYSPKVVVIEFNPTIPSHVEFVQPRDMSVNQGSSLLSLIALGKQKGYELVCVTDYNGIFVRSELFSHFNIGNNNIACLRPPNPDQCPQFHIFQLYDGTFVVGGGTFMPWFGTAIRQDKFQILPKVLRSYPASSYNVLRRIYRRIWYYFYSRYIP